MSAPRQLFNQFKQEGFALVERVVNENWREDLYLDFKTSSTKTGAFTNDDRKNYAEAASGFANSDGGVVVWGIDARPDSRTGIDEARALRPIKKVRRFISDLDTQLVNLVSPGIDGIEHLPLEDPKQKGDGYVVTLAPKGEGLPHMARGRDQHRYYHRVGSSFVIMEPYVLADRFGRRPQPRLEITWRLEQHGSSSGPGGTTYEIALVIGVQNAGLGIALYPALALRETAVFKLYNRGLDGRGNFGLPERVRTGLRPQEALRFLAGGVDHAIHPGTALYVAHSEMKFHESAQSYPDTIVEYELYCEGHVNRGEFTVPGSRILQFRSG